MKLFGSIKSKIIKKPKWWKCTLFRNYWSCNVANTSYQQNSKVLYTFVSNKSFCQLVTENLTFLKTSDSEFLHNHMWFTDQNSKLLEIEDKINSILVIN